MAARPKPAALKELTGRRPGVSAGGQRIAKHAQPDANDPVMPEELLLDPRAVEIWEQVVRGWRKAGLVMEVDSQQLGAYCWLMAAFWHKAASGGRPDDRDVAQLRAYSGMFGLDPSSRVKLTLPDNGKSSDVQPLEALRRRRAAS